MIHRIVLGNEKKIVILSRILFFNKMRKVFQSYLNQKYLLEYIGLFCVNTVLNRLIKLK